MVSYIDLNNAFRKLYQSVRPFGFYKLVLNVVLQSFVKPGDKATIVLTSLDYKVLKLNVIGGYSPCLGEPNDLVLRITLFVLIVIQLAYA